MFPLYTLLLAGVLLIGMVIIAAGAVLLLKGKNKIAGILTMAAGLAISVLPFMVLLFLITMRYTS